MKQPSRLSAGEACTLPAGYLRLTVNGRSAVVSVWAAAAIRTLLAEGTLHDWAASQKVSDPLQGRGINYGVMLPAGTQSGATTPVVVRRNRHGGLLGPVTGELFLAPTRAPLELANSVRLAAAGVSTPEVIAYALYPAFMNFVYCDVVTRRLAKGADFPEAWRTAAAPDRATMLRQLASLLQSLSRAGAWHADLNLKNIYVAGNGAAMQLSVLDVDRVTFPDCSDIAQRNFTRLARSARKWHGRWGLDFDETALERLAALIQERH